MFTLCDLHALVHQCVLMRVDTLRTRALQKFLSKKIRAVFLIFFFVIISSFLYRFVTFTLSLILMHHGRTNPWIYKNTTNLFVVELKSFCCKLIKLICSTVIFKFLFIRTSLDVRIFCLVSRTNCTIKIIKLIIQSFVRFWP